METAAEEFDWQDESSDQCLAMVKCDTWTNISYGNVILKPIFAVKTHKNPATRPSITAARSYTTFLFPRDVGLVAWLCVCETLRFFDVVLLVLYDSLWHYIMPFVEVNYQNIYFFKNHYWVPIGLKLTAMLSIGLYNQRHYMICVNDMCHFRFCIFYVYLYSWYDFLYTYKGSIAMFSRDLKFVYVE